MCVCAISQFGSMGCASSKESHGCLPSLQTCHCLLNQSAPCDDADADIDSRHVVCLTSSSYGLLCTETSPPQGSFLSFHGRSRCAVLQACKNAGEEDSLLRPFIGAEEDAQAMEMINTWELMEGLEEGCCSASEVESCKITAPMESRSLKFKASGVANRRHAPRHAPHELWCCLHAADAVHSCSSSPVWAKYRTQPDMAKVKESAAHVCHGEDGLPRTASHCSHLSDSTRNPPCRSSETEASRSTSSNPLHRRSSRLKLPLSPANSMPLLTKKGRYRAPSLSFDISWLHWRKKSFDRLHGSPAATKASACPPPQTMDSSKDPGKEMFDPALVASFEQALDTASQLPQDDWLQHSMDENTTNSSSSDNTWPLSEMASDAESGPQFPKQEMRTREGAAAMRPLQEEEKDASLSSYELKCPPRGIDKVVLYYTSLRGIRKTHEDCCCVRLILKGLGVYVEERDVWMHSPFKEELRNVLGGDMLKGRALVPQLFVKGRYIGGAEEVKKLHEDAKLATLMDGVAKNIARKVCDGCGDARFVPCLDCSGSCKMRNDRDEVVRCPVCNENGLIMCPVCMVK